MITIEQVSEILGRTAFDRDHKKVGEIGQVFLDDATGRPEWMTVRTGMFGTKETFVPLEPAEMRGEDVVVPFSKDEIKDAPTVSIEEEHLPLDQEQRLYEHYGLQYEPVADAEMEAPAPVVEAPMTEMDAAEAGVAEADIAEMETAEAAEPEVTAPETMTRSEEHLRVGTEERETGRARLRKYVTTEYEQQTVPVRREHVRVEREPISDEERRSAGGTDFVESEQEVILHEDRPVVGRETVPVERVRMDKETVVEDETVAGEVRKEHIVAEEDIERSARAAAMEDEQYESEERYEP